MSSITTTTTPVKQPFSDKLLQSMLAVNSTNNTTTTTSSGNVAKDHINYKGNSKDNIRITLNDVDEDDEDSLCSEGSTMTSGGNSTGKSTTKDESQSGRKEIAQRENQAIMYSRILVIGALLVFGSVLGGVAYYMGRQSEEKAWQSQFENMAYEVITLSQDKVVRVFDVLDSLSVTMISFAKHNAASNVGFPPGFLTLPDSEVHFGMARHVSEAFVMAYLPLVEEPDRDAWEEYSIKHQRWIEEANRVVANSTNITTTSSNTAGMFPIVGDIWSYPPKGSQLGGGGGGGGGCSSELRPFFDKTPRVQPQGTGPYSPVWMLSPPPSLDDTHIINYNMVDKPVLENAVKFINRTRKPTFVDVCPGWFGAEDPSAGDNVHTVVIQPVFQEFDHASKIVGHLAAVIPWNVFFEDILSDTGLKISVVMSNTCGEEFTYEVAGPRATLLDEIDVHNPAYSDQKVSSVFVELANPEESLGDVLGEHCFYTISVYPTDEMVKSFQTDQPILYLGVVASIFIFTALAFLLYDMLVRRRQAIVLNTATKTQALVTTLFPKQVQDRILNLVDDQDKHHYDTSFFAGGKRLLNTTEEHDNGPVPAHMRSPAIADFYPETTIMFADISGFTAWSSMRQPSEVFTLLETLYYEFDKLARKRKVFKVETIGDCYVAVCGLPEAVPHHHIIMSLFARDCLAKMGTVTKDLEMLLGVGTADLGLRVGLHSGPVTAGVLRGEKARFQLFGDSMNTASRLESTGINIRYRYHNKQQKS